MQSSSTRGTSRGRRLATRGSSTGWVWTEEAGIWMSRPPAVWSPVWMTRGDAVQPGLRRASRSAPETRNERQCFERNSDDECAPRRALRESRAGLAFPVFRAMARACPCLPLFARRNQVQTVCQGPNTAGRSRHAMTVRYRQTMPSTISRASANGLPLRPVGRGNIPSIKDYRASDSI